jgi:hypothetical protein
MSETEQISWGTLAGLSVIKNIQSKVRNGNTPNFLEAMIVVGWRLSQVVEWIIRLIYGWILKPAYMLIKWVAKNLWKFLKESVEGTLKALGRTVYNVARLLFFIAILGVMGYVAWNVYAHGVQPLAALEQLFVLTVAIIRG